MVTQRKIDNIICLDPYEKAKLGSLFSIHKDDTLFVMNVENIIDNEIIVRIKDKSSHSITLIDKENAYNLFLLIKEIKNNKRRYIGVEDSNSNINNIIKIITELDLF